MENNPTLTSKKVAVTLTLPTPQGIAVSIKEMISSLSTRVATLAYSVYNPLSKNVSSISENRKSFQFPRLPKFSFNGFNKKKMMKFGFPLLIGVLAIVGVVSLVKALPNAKGGSATTVDDVNVPDAVSAIELNRTFAFPLRDEKGKDIGKFDFIIQKAELRKQIIVQGKRATAVNGRMFLVFDLKVVNNLKFPMELPTRNFMRIILNNNSKELLAPDIHNDPVEVQAISTKYTRLGLAIDESAAKQTIKVQVGEVDGTKQTIDLNFK